MPNWARRAWEEPAAFVLWTGRRRVRHGGVELTHKSRNVVVRLGLLQHLEARTDTVTSAILRSMSATMLPGLLFGAMMVCEIDKKNKKKIAFHRNRIPATYNPRKLRTQTCPLSIAWFSARAASGLRCPRSCPRALCSLLTFLELFARFSLPRVLCSLLTFLEFFARFSHSSGSLLASHIPRALCSLLPFLELFARFSHSSSSLLA